MTAARRVASRSSLESFFSRVWMRRGFAACCLWPLSLVFGALSALRRALYARGVLRSERLPVPVIVVGNIFVGGTGKTPLTIWLVEALRRQGLVPGVISRGYGVSSDAPREVRADSRPQEVGDEPVLIARRTGVPLMVGRNRVAAARALLAAHPEVNILLSDDGLQHYALQRDVEIVLCDVRGNGNGWLLPAGPLREPATRKRDFTVINGTPRPVGLPPDAVTMQLRGDMAECLDGTLRMRLRDLRGRRLLAAAGIGNPGRFFAMLRDAGLQFEELPLPDHYDFSRNPFTGHDVDVILITEKDAVKCQHYDALKNDKRIWVVPVTAHIGDALAENIVEKCRG